MSPGSQRTLAWVLAVVYLEFTKVIFDTRASQEHLSSLVWKVRNTLLHSRKSHSQHYLSLSPQLSQATI